MHQQWRRLIEETLDRVPPVTLDEPVTRPAASPASIGRGISAFAARGTAVAVRLRHIDGRD
jgi:hypothetical protein